MPVQSTIGMPLGEQVLCVETGKMKNCNKFGRYEEPNTSATAALCNGGVLEGELYYQCPSMVECVNRTHQRQMAKNTTHLPVMRQTLGSNVLASTLRTPPRTTEYVPYVWRPNGEAPAPRIAQPQPMQRQVQQQPGPVARTHAPYSNNVGVGGPNVSPTFMPRPDESIWSRLGKNVMQGWINSTGWHVFDYSRSIDLFS